MSFFASTITVDGTRGRRLAPMIVLLTALGMAGATPARADEARLEELRRALEDARERVAGFERRERGLLETLEAVERAVEALRRDADVARENAERARARLAKVEAEGARLELQQAVTRAALAKRSRALYRAGELGPVRVLFSARTLHEFLSRLQLLEHLVGHDARLLAGYRAGELELAGAGEAAREAAQLRDRAAERLARRTAELEAERATRLRLISRAHWDRARERATLVELEAAAHAFEETLGTLSLGKGRQLPWQRRAAAFSDLRGRLPPPVEAPVLRSFGRVVEEEFRTTTFRKGIDFGAPQGAKVEAVAAGEVRFAGWFRGYGRIVILDHGDEYFTVYGHLEESRVEAGDWVNEGDGLGRVGETGSLSGPRLYFEIRKGGAPLDPAEWLRSGATG